MAARFPALLPPPGHQAEVKAKHADPSSKETRNGASGAVALVWAVRVPAQEHEWREDHGENLILVCLPGTDQAAGDSGEGEWVAVAYGKTLYDSSAGSPVRQMHTHLSL